MFKSGAWFVVDAFVRNLSTFGLIIRKANIAEYEVLVMHARIRSQSVSMLIIRNMEVINENR